MKGLNTPLKKCALCHCFREKRVFGNIKSYYTGNASKSTCDTCFLHLSSGKLPPDATECLTNEFNKRLLEQNLIILQLSNKLNAKRIASPSSTTSDDEIARLQVEVKKLQTSSIEQYEEHQALKRKYNTLAWSGRTPEYDQISMAYAAKCAEYDQMVAAYDAKCVEYDQLHVDYIDSVNYSVRLEQRLDAINVDVIVDKYLL